MVSRTPPLLPSLHLPYTGTYNLSREATLSRSFDVLILGAGAAGLFCAFEAAKRGRRVALIEHADRIGKKILISGGGRCNFTNLHAAPENFHSANPHFAKSALARYTPADFLALVKQHHIPCHEKTLGQLFCDRSATDITTLLESECHAAKVQIFLNTRITEVQRTTEFVLHSDPTEFRAPILIVATGGLSIPKIGATSFGYDLARQFGHNIIRTRPALVPVVFNREDHHRYSELTGVSAEVVASANNQSFREKMLFTHRGLSGPAILQVSSYWQPGQPIHLDLAPTRDATADLRASSRRDPSILRKALHQFLPNRLADRWLHFHSLPDYTNASLAAFEKQLHNWAVRPADTEGYAKAEVTAGGIDTRELSSKSMESRLVSGLFFIGEVVDVTGQLGGFNFQWAWASAAAAARSL
ncbi:MAG TPA: NAD(P)/FAD-dependent oxidoreductase [Verrucomicrobiae bacterium]|nr:NAD(P)/FAD-dependent oxidoreductase [Verrucomicrobiae bacterium]